ncbi:MULTISPECIES: DUF2125 domain-containing protein [Asticcacaulis]|uniref:DUF2125 domain-containing protein n=1 Tax=Asticcacaulis TaxID=76890 RepID=UPI001AE67B30|nr:MULTISPECIES: DUF2125 domain-containing protein [Asticcacaulis]MBP2158046.1 hypothetical protein [Asticcacaulis solisilvae]MDR6799091.1 hypothetical protein [Asticcacaulis sp. BE141]
MPDTHADLPPAPPPRKRSKIGLFGPALLVVALAAGWSAYWFYVAHNVETTLKAQQEGLVRQGYRVSVAPYQVSGYPFRVSVNLRNLSIIAPSGRGIDFPELDVAANAYMITKWVAVAPKGATLHRGGDLGTLAVSGSSLRASLSGITRTVPNIAIEANDLSLVPSNAAKPFTFDSAKKFEAYVRPNAAASNSADVLARVSQAHGQASRFVGDFSPGKPLDMHVEATLNTVTAFQGRDFATGLKAWKQAGSVTAFRSELKNAELTVMATSDKLTYDANGKPVGRLNAEMTGTFRPLDVLAAAGLMSRENMTAMAPLLNMTLATVGAQKLAVDFRDGGAFVGPFRVSEAPDLP